MRLVLQVWTAEELCNRELELGGEVSRSSSRAFRKTSHVKLRRKSKKKPEPELEARLATSLRESGRVTVWRNSVLDRSWVASPH